MRSTKPTLYTVLEAQQKDTKISMNCVQVGTIQEFDSAKQTATVKISMKQIVKVNPDLSEVYSEYPLILKVPVMVLFGGVDFMSMPIEPGDSCILLFNDRCLDDWKSGETAIAPSHPRLHSLTDAIAIVGIRPLTNSIATYLANGIRLSHGGGNSRVDLTDNLITTIATLFYHHGNMRVSGNTQIDGSLTVLGDTYGNSSGNMTLKANIVQEAGKAIHAGNGANGTFNIVTVVDGIVVSGS